MSSTGIEATIKSMRALANSLNRSGFDCTADELRYWANQVEKANSISEQELWDIAVVFMDAKGRHRMANYMAHGWELMGTVGDLSVLKQDDRRIAIDNAGNLFSLQPAAG